MVDYPDLLEIDGDGAALLSDRATKNVDVITCNSPADAQHNKMSLSLKSVNSAGHSG
jgi:hypothetical protein